MNDDASFLDLVLNVCRRFLRGVVSLIYWPRANVKDWIRYQALMTFAMICLIYVLNPLDLCPMILCGPFGGVDDLIAMVFGLCAWQEAQEIKQRLTDKKLDEREID